MEIQIEEALKTALSQENIAAVAQDAISKFLSQRLEKVMGHYSEQQLKVLIHGTAINSMAVSASRLTEEWMAGPEFEAKVKAALNAVDFEHMLREEVLNNQSKIGGRFLEAVAHGAKMVAKQSMRALSEAMGPIKIPKGVESQFKKPEQPLELSWASDEALQSSFSSALTALRQGFKTSDELEKAVEVLCSSVVTVAVNLSFVRPASTLQLSAYGEEFGPIVPMSVMEKLRRRVDYACSEVIRSSDLRKEAWKRPGKLGAPATSTTKYTLIVEFV